MPDERRQDPRVPVDLRVVERSGATTYFRYASNLSAGGLYLEQTPSHEPGTVVNVSFIIPGERNPESLSAEVVGNEGARGMRLRFVNADGDVRDRLAAYVGSTAR